MASIVKRRNKYCVVYKYKDEKGKEKQRWESFDTKREAKTRKIEVEHEQSNNTFLVHCSLVLYGKDTENGTKSPRRDQEIGRRG